MPQLVECYRQVFATEPWNEWKKCAVCGRKWGIDSQSELESLQYWHCGAPVVDYWPTKHVNASIRMQVDHNASCWLALSRGSVVGFVWGFSISPEKLAEKMERPELVEEITRRFGKQEFVCYQAEIGLLKEYRNRKIASRLAALRLRDMKQMGLEVGVVRTMMNPPSVTFLWFQRDGFEIILRYNDEGERVIQARSYKGYEMSVDTAAQMAKSGPP